MPGPVSESSEGPPDDSPFVPSWCYPDNEPRMCFCGHHEGWHDDLGECAMIGCKCPGMPEDQKTSLDDMWPDEPLP